MWSEFVYPDVRLAKSKIISPEELQVPEILSAVVIFKATTVAATAVEPSLS